MRTWCVWRGREEGREGEDDCILIGDEFLDSAVVSAQLAYPVQQAGLTGMDERQVWVNL